MKQPTSVQSGLAVRVGLGLIACILLLCGVLPAAPIPPEGGKMPYYFPTQVGTKRVYAVNKRPDQIETVVESEEKNGRFLVNVKIASADQNDESISIVRYEVSRDGLFLVATGLETKDRQNVYDVPCCFLKLPHKVGEKWGDRMNKQTPEMVAGKIEMIKVPAGTFEAIRVDEGENSTSWYAPGVGLVKYEYNGNYQKLKSITFPKK